MTVPCLSCNIAGILEDSDEGLSDLADDVDVVVDTDMPSCVNMLVASLDVARAWSDGMSHLEHRIEADEADKIDNLRARISKFTSSGEKKSCVLACYIPL